MAVTALLTLAACSGSDDGGSESAETTTPAEAAADAPATTQAEDETSESSAGDGPTSGDGEDGGEDGGSIEGDDEEAAAAVAAQLVESVFRGDVDGVLEVLTDDCRDQVDRDDIEAAIGFVGAFVESAGSDPDDFSVVVSGVEISGDDAEVTFRFDGPDELAELGMDEDDTVDLVRDGDRWAVADCDFEGAGELTTDAGGDEQLAAELAALGLAGTADDPIPAGIGAPVGEGMWMSVDAIDPDAKAAIEADPDAFLSEIQPDERYVLVTVTVANRGPEEPKSAGSVYVQLVGGSNPVGYDTFGCGSVPDDLQSPNVDLFVGGVHSGNLCFVVPADQIDGALISVESGFSSRSVFFDPTTTAGTPAPLTPSTGIQPDGSLATARSAPQPLGTAVDIGGGWTMSVDEFVPDATAEIQAISEFSQPPPDGEVYSLATLTLTYDGEEDSLSPFSVELGAVGDSNASSDDDCFVDLGAEELDMFADLFQGGSISGQVCFTIPRDQLDSVLLYASGDFFSESRTFFAVS
jgi:hypothetical protein